MAIHLYYGKGKGKTTAAFGLALRALGRGQKVVIVQFMKKGDFGEIKALKKFPQAMIKQFGEKDFIRQPRIKDKELARRGLGFAQFILSQKPDVLVLDELNTAITFKLLPIKEVLFFLKQVPENIEVVVTGRGDNREIKKIADLVTEMKEVKHYYKKGRKAKAGIEF